MWWINTIWGGGNEGGKMEIVFTTDASEKSIKQKQVLLGTILRRTERRYFVNSLVFCRF